MAIGKGTKMTSQPVLYIFAISHYCEKARWALDHFGISYRLHRSMPGTNRRTAKKLGLSSGSLPFLQVSGRAVAGSSAIIDWANDTAKTGDESLNGVNPQLAREIEKRLDDVAGIHVRRFYYSDALLSDPASVRPIFSNDLPFPQKFALILAWSKIVPIMIKSMDLGEAQGHQSYKIISAELDWLDELLADGRPYLTGDSFTRADLTAASLLAPFVNPAKHPVYAALSLPPLLAATIEPWQNRPVLQWVRSIYDRHR
jgi:glutathione S-transferase